MNNAQELRQDIEHCVIQHPEFRKHADSLQQRIDDAIAGYSPRIEWLIGPPQVGKHVLCNMLSRQYPSQRINGKLQIPVLAANLPSSITPEILPTMLLSKLGQPLPQKTSENDVMFKRLCDWLHLAGTKVVIFENASYLVNPRARMQPLGAGDWFKSLAHITGVTVVLMGLPRLEQLFTCNPELRSSASKRREFRPYDARISDDFRAFAACVNTYAEIFQTHGFPIALGLTPLVRHCYLLTGGVVGLLSRFMQELARLISHEAPRALTFADCACAAATFESSAHPDFPAFTSPEVSDVELTQAHMHLLEDNGMLPLRRPTPQPAI